ncbi:MAG: LysR family transcriptional regulator [Eubacteriaceae bacterium]|jgi:DNA-binding transcriptional LysR family regulator
MELRLLRYFTAVVQEGNITRAADKLCITQPTLSRQLAQLEEELGASLLDRSHKSIELTNDGALLYQQALDILELADKTEREFRNSSEHIDGTITIGATESAGSMVLPELIGNFSRLYPRAAYDLYSGYTDDIKEKIDKGIVDIGILTEPVEITKYDYVKLPQEDFWGIMVRSDDPLAERKAVSFSDIIDRPLMMPRRESVRSEIKSWFRDSSRLNIFATYNVVSNAALLVQKGLATALCLNSIGSFRQSEDLIFIPFTEMKYVGSVLIWKKNYMYSPTTTRFLDMVKDTYRA